MKAPKLENIIVHAEDQCKRSGARLTEKRKKILGILLQSNFPLSAYDVAEQYNKNTLVDIHTMSVYRILEFLEDEGFVHKIQSANKFMACSHIDGDCIHRVAQFLVCRSCNKVTEILVPQNIVDLLTAQAKEAEFRMIGSQLELQCICDACCSD